MVVYAFVNFNNVCTNFEYNNLYLHFKLQKWFVKHVFFFKNQTFSQSDFVIFVGFFRSNGKICIVKYVRMKK